MRAAPIAARIASRPARRPTSAAARAAGPAARRRRAVAPVGGRHDEAGRGADRLEHLGAVGDRRLLAVGLRDRLGIDVRPAFHERRHDRRRSVRRAPRRAPSRAPGSRRRPRAVRSSAVGPRPPLVTIRSTPWPAMNASAARMSSGRSPTIAMCGQVDAQLAQRSASQGPLRSLTRPVRTSVPVTTIPARALIAGSLAGRLLSGRQRLAAARLRDRVADRRAGRRRRCVGCPSITSVDRVVTERDFETVCVVGGRRLRPPAVRRPGSACGRRHRAGTRTRSPSASATASLIARGGRAGRQALSGRARAWPWSAFACGRPGRCRVRASSRRRSTSRTRSGGRRSPGSSHGDRGSRARDRWAAGAAPATLARARRSARASPRWGARGAGGTPRPSALPSRPKRLRVRAQEALDEGRARQQAPLFVLERAQVLGADLRLRLDLGHVDALAHPRLAQRCSDLGHLRWRG